MTLAIGWEAQGSCVGTNPELFFPEGAGNSNEAIANAKRVCAGCPVRLKCLEFAQANREAYGVWGGLTTRERWRLRRKRRMQDTNTKGDAA